jgi:predicted amidohydrolase
MRIGVYQCEAAGLSAEQRLWQLARALEQAKARVLVCPELFMSGYAIGDDVMQRAEPADGTFAKAVAGLAKRSGTAVVYGYPELAGGKTFNSAQCIDADGVGIANHRKLVLPPGFERNHFAFGQELTLFEIGGINFGLCICYDAEFPETVRALALAGAQVVLVPTALGADWDVVADRVIPTRAFENGVYLAYANHAGSEGNMDYLGRSCIVDPMGRDAARAEAEELVITADVDVSSVTAAQERLPYLTDIDLLGEFT